MSFYFVLLGLHGVVTALLIWMLLRWASRRRQTGKRIHYWGYAAPIILAAVCVTYIVFFTAPFVLDLFRIMNRTYEVATYQVEDVRGPFVYLEGGIRMLRNPFEANLEPGKQYQLTFLPRSLYIQNFILLR